MASETAPVSPPPEAPSTAPTAPTAPPETAPVATPPPVESAPEVPAKVEPPAAPSAPPEPLRPPAARAVANLMRERAKVRGSAAELTQGQKRLQEEQEKLTQRGQELSQVEELKGLISTNPVEAAKRLAGGEEALQGFLQKLTDDILANGQGKPAGLSKEDRAQLEQVKGLQDEVTQLKKASAEREEHLKQERSRLETQELEYRAAQYLDAGWKECSKVPDEYELVMATDSYRGRVEQRVIQNGTKAAEEANALGKKPAPLTPRDFLEAAQQVQAELEKELEPVLSTKRIQKRFAPAQAAPGTAAPGEQPTPPKTLTTERGDPAVSPEWASMSVADRLYAFQRGIKPRTGGTN